MAKETTTPVVPQDAVKTPELMDDPTFWEGLLTRLDQAGASSNIFPKNGKTRVRLLALDPRDAIREVISIYQGRRKTKYMILAYSPDAEEAEFRPKALVLAKTAYRGIVALLAEGYQFFSPQKGHGVTIIRSGSGRDTNYTVIASPKPVPVPEAMLKLLAEVDIDEMAAEYSKRQLIRAGGAQGGASDSQVPPETDQTQWEAPPETDPW